MKFNKPFIYLIGLTGGIISFAILVPGVLIIALGLIFFNLGFAILKLFIKVIYR